MKGRDDASRLLRRHRDSSTPSRPSGSGGSGSPASIQTLLHHTRTASISFLRSREDVPTSRTRRLPPGLPGFPRGFRRLPKTAGGGGGGCGRSRGRGCRDSRTRRPPTRCGCDLRTPANEGASGRGAGAGCDRDPGRTAAGAAEAFVAAGAPLLRGRRRDPRSSGATRHAGRNGDLASWLGPVRLLDPASRSRPVAIALREPLITSCRDARAFHRRS